MAHTNSPLSFKGLTLLQTTIKPQTWLPKFTIPLTYTCMMTVLSPKNQPGDNVKDGADMTYRLDAERKNSCDLGTRAKGEIR